MSELPLQKLSDQIAYVQAACLLHNFVEQNADKCLPRWVVDPVTVAQLRSLEMDQPDCGLSDIDGAQARIAILHHVDGMIARGLLPKAPEIKSKKK